MIYIGIIGSRDLSDSRYSYSELVGLVRDRVTKIVKDEADTICFVSGGSTWADHIAVTLRNEMKSSSLILYLPSNLNENGFVKTDGDKGASNTLNTLHKEFMTKTQINSIKELIDTQKMRNVTYIVKPGFLTRNAEVAKQSQYLIALTHGETKPDTPGTTHTWNLCGNLEASNRIHINV